jgi:hypothetical protein
MNIVCIGGGPAGLYFGLLMKLRHPAHEVTVIERNRPCDTFGWGVVFSDATMENMRQWDAVTAAEIRRAFNHWDDIELHFKGAVIRSGGHGFVGIGRKKLLNILQARCEALDQRRGAGDGGDDQPAARGPHHPRLPGAVERHAAGGVCAHRRFRAPAQQCPDRPAARAQRPQGLHPAGLGGL